jgi:predicted MFS family arabinose efflux permease
VIAEEFEASRAGVAATFSWAMFVIGISSPLVGPALDRWGPRRLFCGGGLALAAGGMVAALAPSVSVLHLGFGIGGGAGASLLGWVVTGALLGRVPLSRPTTALGVAYGGMGVGTLIGSPLAQRIILAAGWRWAMAIMSGVAGLVLLVLNGSLRLPERPGEQHGGAGRPRQGPGPMATLALALRTGHFWLYFLAFLTIGTGMFAVLAHQVAYLVDRGFAPLLAASVFGVTQVLGGIGRVVFGVVTDRWGRALSFAASFALSIAGIGCLILVRNPGAMPLLYVFVVIFGVSFGARGPILTGMAAGHFGGPMFGAIFGAISLAHGVGTALGPWLAGVLYDRTGDYRVPFLLAMLTLGLACVATLTLTRLPRPSGIPSP